MTKKQIFDIAVIGGGPAGLSAALTGRIRNKQVALFEHRSFSQKLQRAHTVENYLGLPAVSGQDMMRQFADHCLKHQPTLIKEKVMNVFPGVEGFTLLTPDATYEAKSIILTTGVTSATLLSGERELLGRGVSYCATCDGMLYRGRDVAVISYTPEGEQEADFLSEICLNVHYLPQYKQTPQVNANVEVLCSKPLEVNGKQTVEELVTDKGTLKVDGVFILRHSDPVENILPGLELGDGDVIVVQRDMSTNIPGVFAAGDCTGKPWQIAKATGEGLVAVFSAIQYLEQQQRKTAPSGRE